MKITERLWVRRIVMVAAAALLLALIIHPVLNALIQTDDPATELATFEKKPIPDQKNAARWLDAGAGAIVWSEEEKQVIGEASYPPYNEWDNNLKQRVHTVIENHRGAISTMNKAVGLDQSSYSILYSKGFDGEVPDFIGLIWSARLLLVEARIGLGSCTRDDGFLAVATLERLASSLEEESSIVAVLFGAATERMLLLVVTELITSDSSCQIGKHDLDYLASLIPQVSMTDALSRVITVETGFGRLALASSDLPTDDQAVKEAQTLELRQQLLDLVEEPYSVSRAKLEDLGRGPVTNDDHPARGVHGYRNFVGRAQSIIAQRQLVRALIYLKRFGLDHDSFPANRPDIPELVTPNPVTGEPILYTHNVDGSVTLEIIGVREMLKDAMLPVALDSMGPVTLASP